MISVRVDENAREIERILCKNLDDNIEDARTRISAKIEKQQIINFIHLLKISRI